MIQFDDLYKRGRTVVQVIDNLHRLILDNSVDLCYQRDLRTNIYDYLNTAAAEVLGKPHEDLVNKNFEELADLIHPDDKQRVLGTVSSAMQSQIDGRAFGQMEYRLRHSDRNYRWYSEHFCVIFDNNMPCKIIGNVHDITQIKKLQRALEESESKYKQLFDNSRVALFCVAADGSKVLLCNDLFARILKYENKEQCMQKLVPIECAVTPEWSTLAQSIISNKQLSSGDVRVRRFDGLVVDLKWSAKYYPDQDYIEGVAFPKTADKLLTKSEIAVLKNIIEGLTNKEIAVKLHRSVRTIEDQRSSMMHKLGVKNSIELAKRALDLAFPE